MNTPSIALRPVPLRIPDLPIAVWMVAGALVAALVGGMDAPDLLSVFNDGWGRALGDFALILLPSFTLAAALSRQPATGGATTATAIGPVAAAGMVCPDTAYAALAPIARGRGLAVALGAYPGFKLLFPAGPLLVAIGLGVDGSQAFGLGVLLCLPVWAAGLLWAGRFAGLQAGPPENTTEQSGSLTRSLMPFAVLVILIGAGVLFDFARWPSLDFLTRPAGALTTAALLALTGLNPGDRRECLDSGIRRTATLLFLIGAAGALGAVLVAVTPLERLLTVTSGMIGLFTVVGITAVFKLVQGSSMATFAAVTPLVAPFVESGNLSATATILAVCIGSLVAVLPNDSFYWLVRQHAFAEQSERQALVAITSGTVVQGLVGILGLFGLYAAGLLG